jgi:biopolymer transport protein ExbD
MHIRADAGQDDSPINLTPMMDVVFNLLIFFLVATTIVQEEREIGLKLPETTRADAATEPPRQLIINIGADGSTVVAGRTYDAAALSQMLAGVAKERPARNVLIRADERSTFRHFADVMDLCRRVGIAEAKIGYVKQEP